MGRKVAQGLCGKSGGSDGREDGNALPAATSGRARKSRDRSHGSPITPSRKREGIHGGANPLMPGLRIREDGWTVARTRTFLALLAQTGCVTDAARVAGVSRTSVNRSRKLFAPFDKACRDALAKALRGLEAVAYARAVEGREMVILRDGKEVERRIVPSDSLLALLLKRGDLKNGRDIQMTPEEAAAYVLPEAVRHRFLSREEYFSGITFDKGRGDAKAGKCRRPTPDETDAEILRRIAIIERSRSRADSDAGCCRACGQPLGEAAQHRLKAKAAQEVPARAALWERPPIALPPPSGAAE